MPRKGPWSIYKKHMGRHDYGDALWDPTPTQDYTRIKIGDVGFIDKGKFHLLFSAGSPLGERQLGRDVPDKFESLSVGTPTCGEPRKPDCLRTSTVRHIGAGLGTTEFISRLLENRASCSFELTGDCGAALLTMDPTYPEDSPAKSEFDEYTKRHYESWVNFSRHKHGRDDIRPILVSGFDMTKNFAMVAYSRKDTSNQEYFHDFPMFSSAFAPFEGTWRANFTPYTNHGPPQSEGAGSLANECNQCVFIRYYITRTRGWWARLRNELARVGGRLRDSDSGSNGGNASPGPTGGSNVKPTASDDRPPGIQGGDTDSEPGIMIRNTQDDEGYDSWDVIADYVFQNSNATSVLMHHRDLAEFRAAGDLGDLSSLLAMKRPRIAVGESGVGRIICGESAQLAQQETIPPHLHPRRTLTLSPGSQILQKLRSLDTSPSKLHYQLSNVLYGEEYQQCIPSLRHGEVVWLVDYSDRAAYLGSNGLNPVSLASGKCLRELRSIRGTREILPTSYSFSSHLLGICPNPFVPWSYSDAYEGTRNGLRVCINRVRMYVWDSPQTMAQTFYREAVVWQNLTHPNILPFMCATVNPPSSSPP